MSLATLYRPRLFDEVVGNTKTIKSIESILNRNRSNIPSSWLFTGPSGCGKTTLARIIASELDCREDDLTELDAADFRGIDNIRDIREQMRYAPIKSKCRVWILDECHQLTKDAQEALLKGLEDTPAHVFFILCTTEPKKLKTTLRNRCIQFTVEPISNKNMIEFLGEVVYGEGKEIGKVVLKKIAENSSGSCRIALQTLETVLDLPLEEMLERVQTISEKDNAIIDLCRALFKGESWGNVAQILKNIDGEQPESIRLAVMGYCSSILLNGKDSEQAFIVMDSFKEPLYVNGKAGLILMAYEAMTMGKEDPIPF